MLLTRKKRIFTKEGVSHLTKHFHCKCRRNFIRKAQKLREQKKPIATHFSPLISVRIVHLHCHFVFIFGTPAAHHIDSVFRQTYSAEGTRHSHARNLLPSVVDCSVPVEKKQKSSIKVSLCIKPRINGDSDKFN